MGPRRAVGPGLLFLLLLLLLGAVCGATGEIHSLQYFYTAMTDPGPGMPWFVVAGYVDGENFVRYDSTVQRVEPRTEWVNAAAAADAEYWDGNTRNAQGSEQVNRVNLVTLRERFNQSGGSHTVQEMYGCDILEDGTTQGYFQGAYDGRDFIAFDKDMKTFTAAVPEAVPTKVKWESLDEPGRWKQYLQETCVEWLRRYVEYGKAELGRREQPEVRVIGKEANKILTLSCRAHGFYPRPIVISWVKDGVVQDQDTHSGGTNPNSDGTYYACASIDTRPEDGHKYQCRVEHASLSQPGLYSWEPPSNLVPILAGVAVAIVALAVVAGVGFVIWRRSAGKKEKGYNIAPAQDSVSSSLASGSNHA